MIMGQVLQAGAGQAPARQAAIGAGLPKETPADTINKVCASSIRAVEIADSMIRAGDVDVVVTGGMESMSNAPYLLKKARFGYRLGDGELIDSMIYDGLTSTFDGLHMVEQDSSVARELGITREEQDEWASARTSARRPRKTRAGSPTRSLPVGDVTADESIRRDTTFEKLAALKPVFDPEGTTTAGNAPGVNDGASCVIVCSEEWAASAGSSRSRPSSAQGYVADDFAYLARTPANAGAMALERAGKTIDDVAGSRSTRRSRRSPRTRRSCSARTSRSVNVNGGAVALGHPIGASRRPHRRDDGARAATQGWRAGPGGDLPRRRPGRRAPARGLGQWFVLQAA